MCEPLVAGADGDMVCKKEASRGFWDTAGSFFVGLKIEVEKCCDQQRPLAKKDDELTIPCQTQSGETDANGNSCTAKEGKPDVWEGSFEKTACSAVVDRVCSPLSARCCSDGDEEKKDCTRYQDNLDDFKDLKRADGDNNVGFPTSDRQCSECKTAEDCSTIADFIPEDVRVYIPVRSF